MKRTQFYWKVKRGSEKLSVRDIFLGSTYTAHPEAYGQNFSRALPPRTRSVQR